MVKRRLYIWLIIVLGVLILLMSVFFSILSKAKNKTNTVSENVISKNSIQSVKTTTIPQKDNLKDTTVKHNLYSESNLSLYSIMEIAMLPDNAKKNVESIIKQNPDTFYVLKKDNEKNKIILIYQPLELKNDRYTRHNLEYAEIMLNENDNVIPQQLSYNGEDNEISDSVSGLASEDDWQFDNSQEVQRPLKHTKYEQNGAVKFVEKWNYEPDEQIRYEMADGDGNIISVVKEISESDTNYRQEHIFYDMNNKISKSISINYNCDNISSVTYHNIHQPHEDIGIVSTYTDGLKTEEKIYDSNFKLVNTLRATYENGERKSIQLFDSEDRKIDEIR